MAKQANENELTAREYAKQYRDSNPEKVLEWRLIQAARLLLRNGISDALAYVEEVERERSERFRGIRND